MNAPVQGFTPTGLKVEGEYENARNAKHRQLFSDMIREAYGADQVIIAHHLVYVAGEKRIENGLEFDYQIVEEIPSADTLIFDHDAAKTIWGERYWQGVLVKLAMLPVEARDQLLHALYYSRGEK
jgi:hypothetical protein